MTHFLFAELLILNPTGLAIASTQRPLYSLLLGSSSVIAYAFFGSSSGANQESLVSLS